MATSRAFRALVPASLLAAACGGDARPTAPAAVATPAPGYASQVESVIDGDTVRVNPPVLGATSVRLLNVDAPERGGSTQEPWAAEALAELQGLLPVATRVRLETDATPSDTFGRLLAHVTRAADGLAVNRELLRRGRVSLYVIWPNAARFEEHRAAQVAARHEGLGIWRPGRSLGELPFEFRRRQDRAPLTRPVGDFFTRFYVAPEAFAAVSVNNRVFFTTTPEAEAAGFRPCPSAAGGFAASCFGPTD